MNLSFEYFSEPKLQFGKYFEHEDSKTGLAEFGPFGKNIEGLHPSEIKLGFIGTQQTVSGARGWIEECGSYIESENVKDEIPIATDRSGSLFDDQDDGSIQSSRRIDKILNRDFPGFNATSEFASTFQMNDRWDRYVRPRDIDHILGQINKAERINGLVDLLDNQLENIASTSPTPDIVIFALTPEMYDKAHSVRVSGNFFLDLRRAIKAKAMRWGIPIQIMRRSTVVGTGRKGRKLQEKTIRAWNFCTAQYYKADGVPWSPISLNRDTCYVGISFFVARDLADTLTIQSSLATAFNYLGQGLVLRGEPFEWNQELRGRTPHLTQGAASKLISDALKQYITMSRTTPKHVIIYKTSHFWGHSHGEYNEIEGFYEGIDSEAPHCNADLVALRPSETRLMREGKYPPLRGTYFCVDGVEHFLYAMGFIPFLETSPAPYVPTPWQITDHHGGSDPKDLFRDMLSLTKMNVNNCSFADSSPIVLSFSRKIGEIMKHIPEGETIRPQYKYYM